MNVSWRRVTISTSGVIPGIQKMTEKKFKVRLAVSLHAPNNELRDELVPLNKQFPLEELIPAVREFSATDPQINFHDFVTFEYVVLPGVNDSKGCAEDLGELLKDAPAHINLIPYHPWEGGLYNQPSAEQIDNFRNLIMDHKKGRLHVSIRQSRGLDIM